jgi:exopolysaccharide biosynthesis polyprenyl glycosylphosphotransferase
MKKLELSFTAIKVPLDAAMIVLAGLTAYWIRVSSFVSEFLPVRFEIDLAELTRVILVVAAIWIVIFALNKLYSIRRMSYREELGRVFYGVSTGMMLVFTVVFFIREIFESRFIVLAAWVLAVIFVGLARLILRAIQRWLVSIGLGQHRVVMIGPKRTNEVLTDEFEWKPGLGFHVIGTRPHFGAETQSWIMRTHKKIGIDEIILTDSDVKREEALRIVAFCDQNQITFMYTADLLETATSRLRSHTFAGIPLFEVKPTLLDGWGRIYKRAFDILISLTLIIVTLPIQIVVAIILLTERQGGFLLSHLPNGKRFTRVGEGGKPFNFYKFRSMIKDAHKLRFDKDFIAEHGNEREGSPLFKLEHDPRITKFGAFIRRYSIDEFPQFYLVLTGKMSFIGPRPHLPEEVAEYKPEWRKVLSIKPGITGIAQISGRADLDFEEEVRLDTHYIENWSPMFDLMILFKTPWVVFKAKGAK